jgi:hypothetical protein
MVEFGLRKSPFFIQLISFLADLLFFQVLRSFNARNDFEALCYEISLLETKLPDERLQIEYAPEAGNDRQTSLNYLRACFQRFEAAKSGQSLDSQAVKGPPQSKEFG